MNRALFVMVVGVGLGMMGCAVGEEDVVEPAPAPQEQKDPPRQSLNTNLRDPQQQLITGIAINRGFENVPPERNPANPPIPAPEQ